MKVHCLPINFLNAQKCLLPYSKFLEDNYGRYCFIPLAENHEILTKIEFSEKKQIRNMIYLDGSVFKYTNLQCINEVNFFKDLNFDQFIILKRPLISHRVKITVVLTDVFYVQKYLDFPNSLNNVVKQILKIFIFCQKSLLFLRQYKEIQNFGINFLIISSSDVIDCRQPYGIDSNTEIEILQCITQVEYEQTQKAHDIFYLGMHSNAHKILNEAIQFSHSNFVKFNSLKKILLSGPCGSGKASLVRNVALQANCILLEISASNINSFNVCEKNKNVLEKIKIYSSNGKQCVLLIKNIDMLSRKNSYSKKFFLQLIDFLEKVDYMSNVIIVATTNSVDEVDIELRMPSRFQEDLKITIPYTEEKEYIFLKIFEECKIKCEEEAVFKQLSQWTPGFLISDLKSLALEILLILKKVQGSILTINTGLLDLCKVALTKVIPSELKGAIGFSTSKNITFTQIGGLNHIKKILDLAVTQQLRRPEKFSKLGVPLTKGILLYGPPGCAKTALVKALASETQATFLSTSASDLYSPYVGDAEKKVVQIFSQARLGSPTIIFIDEIDAVVGSKSGDRERGVQERVLSTLLIEMDGVECKILNRENIALEPLSTKNCRALEKKGQFLEMSNTIIVVGATNYPHLLDDALKRPGRFDRLLYIPPPNEKERMEILKVLTKNMSLHESVNLKYIAEITKFYSGADLKSLCHESGLLALSTSEKTAECIHQFHFERIINEFKPSLNEKIINFYESFQKLS